jgi:hypothetical protein
MSFFGMIGEMNALYKTMTEGTPRGGCLADRRGRRRDRSQQRRQGQAEASGDEEQRDASGAMVHQLGLDLEVLDQKSTPDETRAFKDWLVEIAQATADATKEGGFLGIGAVRVSDKEQMALATLRHELGVG